LALSLAASPLGAQWLGTPDPKVPRTADGKPDLAAPAPKAPDGHPDLSGVWMPNTRTLQDLAAGMTPPGDLPYQPWAAQLVKDRADGARGKEDPAAHCVPGMPKLIVLPYPYKIYQMPGVTVILYEGFTTFRQIFTDGRALPKDPQPSWLGYSVGKWDGDTFVVDVVGFNDKGWLDDGGHPRSEAMHVTEKWRRKDFGHMDIEFTFDDPKTYTKPWSVTIPFNLLPDTEIIENVCENEKDVEHVFFGGVKPK
jgi:hypothetical protein